MDKNITLKNIIQTLNKEKVKDYIYPAIFFLIFSIFIIFAIKPSISTVFELTKEKKDLTEKNEKYQEAINYVSTNLSILESLRDKLYLLDDSLPNTPQVNKIIEDIYLAGDESNISLNSLNLISPIEYSLKKTPVTKPVQIDIEAVGQFDDLVRMIDAIKGQRRIKTIKNIEVSSGEKISTESSTLNIKIQVEGYYL
jgi:Tfp pilus assembly protein PilO